jgi:riboflavin kinase/FMN adenylyltransferase
VDTAARGLTVESHLLDFDRSVTRGTLALRFLGRLRDEQKFPSLDALREQIHADIARARSYTV